MKYYGKAEETARKLLTAFESGNLPKALAQVFLRRKDDVPCRRWSWNNQIITALMGYQEARGFRQWEEVGRKVKPGEKAFYILAPLVKEEKATDEQTGEETTRRILYGFKGLPVFGLEQTEGEPLPQQDTEVTNWIASLPLYEVARSWGLVIEAYNGDTKAPLGQYARGQGIALGVRNLATWAHELIHAADDKNGNLKERGQHWRAEIVAELGGAVLLEILGYPTESDQGGCWHYIRSYAEKADLDPLWACSQVIDRVCKAVVRLLEEAERENGDTSTHPPVEENAEFAASVTGKEDKP